VGTNKWQVDFRYISRRLVRQIVDQDTSARTRWRIGGIPTPWGNFGLYREPIDRKNDFALVREATKSVKDLTSTIAQAWGPYIRAELDLTIGIVTVLGGWKDQTHVEIAAMKAEVVDADVGRVFVAMFGSASNYIGRKLIPDELAETPSDIDGLYGILDRTRELEDPEIDDHFLDRDLGYSPNGRTQEAASLLNGPRFRGSQSKRFDVLMQSFCTDESTKPYDLVILGAPVWIATPGT
jgi:hypothetical protein